MHIAIQGDIHISVAQYFTEAFQLEAFLHAACSKSMAQGVKVRTADLLNAMLPVFCKSWKNLFKKKDTQTF